MNLQKITGLSVSILLMLAYGDVKAKSKKDIERDIDYVIVLGKDLKNSLKKKY